MKISRLGRDLIVAFLIGTSLATVAGIILIMSMQKLDTEYSDALYNYAFATSDIAELSAQIKENGSDMKDIIFLENPEDVNKARDKKAKSNEAIKIAIEKVRVTVQSDTAKEQFAGIERSLSLYETSSDKVVAMVLSGNRQGASSLWLSETYSFYHTLDAAVEETLGFASSGGEEVSIKLRKYTAAANTLGILLVVFGLICSMYMAIRTSKRYSRPVIEIQHAAAKMAQGDFDIELTPGRNDELGDLVVSMSTTIEKINNIIADTSKQLSQVASGDFRVTAEEDYVGVFAEIKTSIDKIADNLSSTMEQVVLASDQVSSGSEQVSNAAQSLAQGATEQASSVQQLSASISEISDQVHSNAENAKYANELAHQVSENITDSNERMGHLMTAMNDISEASVQISKIIKAIEDLAFQTNILALNAAVEAARAGSAGKGFAVVADEVRNLASKSSEAAKQTNELIINSTRSVENGSKIANETADALSQVVQGAGSITELINSIAESSMEQSTSISQINQGIEQVSGVVQTNSATSEESAASSEELSSQASTLKSLVSRFQLKETMGNTFTPQGYVHPAQLSYSNDLATNDYSGDYYENSKY